MTDPELLVQRFLDQELSGEERVRFVVRLGRDEELRRRVIELEQLVLDAARLPRPAVSDAFVARVIDRLAPAPSIWRRVATAIWAPREITWNLATAGAVACGAAFAMAVLVTVASRQAATSHPDAPPTAAAAGSSPVLVRLVVLQPSARTVQVAGDFNGWDPASTSLEQISTGAWTVTLPLEPGRYKYMFVIDGRQWIADPFAAEQSDDGFGSQNAVIDVRPPPVGLKTAL